MTTLHTHDDRTGSGERGAGEKLRLAIAMAVILFAGIAGGILLTSHFKEQAMGYETHAAGYLYETGDEEPAAVAEPATTPTATTTVAAEIPGTGPVCQEYTKLVTIGGESETIFGTACRQPDGTWDIVQ